MALHRSPFTPVPFLILALSWGASEVSAQGRDRTPPTAPTNLTAVAVTEHSVTLSWGPSTDNSGKFTYIVQASGVTVTVGVGTIAVGGAGQDVPVCEPTRRSASVPASSSVSAPAVFNVGGLEGGDCARTSITPFCQEKSAKSRDSDG